MNQPLFLIGSPEYHDDDCACPDKAFLLTFDYGDNTVDTDCACPDHAFHLRHPARHTEYFMMMPDVHTQLLTSGYHLVFSPYAPSGPGVLNQAGWERWQQFQSPQPLGQDIDHVLATQGLIQPVSGRWQPQHSTPHTLTAWLHVTNACNLDCPYCYVRKSSERMSEAVGLQAVRQIFKTAQQHNFKQVKLKYAGGEATLHFKLVRQLHEEATRLAQETGLGLKEVVLSNGVHLRPQDADWLKDHDIKLMISLDGVGEWHDQQRPMKGGGRTFALVEYTVDQILRPQHILPDITITVTGRNAPGVAQAVQWALERSLPVSLNFYRQNMLSASRTELELEEQAIITGMLDAYRVFENILPERPFLNGLLDRVQADAHAHTCGVQYSYLVITHRGQLAQCQMHLEYSQTPDPNDDLLPLVASGQIRNLSVDEKEGCRTCEFRYRCTGGCPLETFRATQRWDVQSPHCHIYKTLMPAAFRLEGLRLLKAHGYLS